MDGGGDDDGKLKGLAGQGCREDHVAGHPPLNDDRHQPTHHSKSSAGSDQRNQGARNPLALYAS